VHGSTSPSRGRPPAAPSAPHGKPSIAYTGAFNPPPLEELAEKTGGIDYAKSPHPPSYGVSRICEHPRRSVGAQGRPHRSRAGELEALKKLYNQSRRIDRQMLRKAFENASHPTVPYIVLELNTY